jgi:hypothetical protein
MNGAPIAQSLPITAFSARIGRQYRWRKDARAGGAGAGRYRFIHS